jgi:hypothetical protein
MKRDNNIDGDCHFPFVELLPMPDLADHENTPFHIKGLDQ